MGTPSRASYEQMAQLQPRALCCAALGIHSVRVPQHILANPVLTQVDNVTIGD